MDSRDSIPTNQFDQYQSLPSNPNSKILTNKAQNSFQPSTHQPSLPPIPIDSRKSVFTPMREYSGPTDHSSSIFPNLASNAFQNQPNPYQNAYSPSIIEKTSSFANFPYVSSQNQSDPSNNLNLQINPNLIAHHPINTVQIQNQFLPAYQAPLNYQNVQNFNGPVQPGSFAYSYPPNQPNEPLMQNQFQPILNNQSPVFYNQVGPGVQLIAPPSTATAVIQNQFRPIQRATADIQNQFQPIQRATAVLQDQFQPFPINQVRFSPGTETTSIQNQFLPAPTNFLPNAYPPASYATTAIQNQLQPIQRELNNSVSVGRVAVKFICNAVMQSSFNSFFSRISPSSSSPPSSSCWHSSQNYLAVGLQDGKVIIYHIPTKKNIAAFQAHSRQVIALEFYKNLLITIGVEGKVRTWIWEENKFLMKSKGKNFETNTRKERFEFEFEVKDEITSFGIEQGSSQIAIGTIAGEVIVLELIYEREKTEEKEKESKGEEDVMNCKGLNFIEKFRYNHEKQVGALSFHPNKIWLASGSQDSLIKIWNLQENKLIIEEKCGGSVFSLCFDENNNLYFRSSNFIRKFNLISQSVTSIKEGPSISSKFLLTISKRQASGGELLIWDEGKCIEIYQTLLGSRFFALGKHDANDLCSLSFCPDGFKFISSGKDNTIRIWENDEYYEILLQAFLSGNQTPRIEHIIYLLNKMRLANESEGPNRLFEFLFQLLPFPCIFFKLKDDSKKYFLTNISKEKLFEINQNNFLSPKNNYVGESKLFDLKILNIENILEVSKESILFFEKIQSFSIENEIFDNIALKYLIEFKWKHFGKKIFLKNLYFYVIFMILFTLNILWFLKNCDVEDQLNTYNNLFFSFSGFIVSMDFILIYFEIQQIKSSDLIRYFGSFWNILDIFVLICTPVSLIATSAAINYKEDLYPFKLICAISFFLIWMRSFDYFRGFESTSVYVVIILKVIGNIKYFLGILLLFLFIFTSFFFVSTDQDPISFPKCLSVFFKLILGDFGDFEFDYEIEGITAVAWIIFCMASVLFVIILLNLLIAIISDSHADIMKMLSRIIGREKINYLIDFESMIMRNQSKLSDLNKELSGQFLVVADQNSKKMHVPDQVISMHVFILIFNFINF